MSASRAVLDAVTTAIRPKLLDGPSWAVGPAKTVLSLWAAEVIDMFGRRGVLAIASESEYPDEPSEYYIVFLSRASGGALRTEARWSLGDLTVVSRGADEVPAAAAAAVAGAPTGSDGDGTANRRGSTSVRRPGADSSASDARVGFELLLGFGSLQAEPWRCALPTPALRDEACWRLLAAGAVLCGGAAETNLQPNELRALATTALEACADASGNQNGEGSSIRSGGAGGAHALLLLRQPSGMAAHSSNSSSRSGGADRIRASPDPFAGPGQPAAHFVDPLLRLIQTSGPAATEALAATASQPTVESTSASSGWTEAEELERVLAEAVERCGFDGLTTSSSPESWRHDFRGSTAASSNNDDSSSSSSGSSGSGGSSGSSYSTSAAAVLDAALGFGMEEVERETVESLLAWELMQERAAAASKASHQNSTSSSSSRRKQQTRRGSMVFSNIHDAGGEDQGGAQPLLATLARLDRQLGVVESWLGSNGAYVDELRHDVLNIESLNALLETRSKNYQRTEACLGTLMDAVTLPQDAVSLLAAPRALLEQAQLHQLPGVANELAAAWTALGRAERAARDGGAPFDPSTLVAAAAASASSSSNSSSSSSSSGANRASKGASGVAAVTAGAVSGSARSDSAHPEGPSEEGGDKNEEEKSAPATPLAPTPTAAEVAAAARQHSAAATQFRTLASLKEQATNLSRLRVTTTEDAAISLDLLCAARVREAASAAAATRAAISTASAHQKGNDSSSSGGSGHDLSNVSETGEGEDRLSTLEESSGRSLSRPRNDSVDSNNSNGAGTTSSSSASSPSKGLPLRSTSRTGFISSAFMKRTTSKSGNSSSSSAMSRTVSRSIPSAFSSLPLHSSSSALMLPLIPPPEAGLRLLECQSAVHQSLDVFDKLFESLYHLEPRHLATLAQSYATATADHLFYPHAKAFFRQCNLSQRNASSSSSSSSSSTTKSPKPSSAALHALPKTTTVAAVASAAAAEGGTGGIESPDSSTGSELRSASSSSNGSDSSTSNQFTSATLGEALTWALMQWMPAIRAEQRFLAVRFRLGKAADAEGVSGDGMFPPGTLPSAAQQAADPPLDRETGRSAWGAEAAAALCGYNFNAQFAKWWQKVKQLCEAPELKESAELLVLLAAIRRATKVLNGDDDDDDEDEDEANGSNRNASMTSSSSSSSNSAAALHAANMAAATLLEDSTLHPNALSPRWLAARLHDLQSSVRARWSKFSDEQAVWTQANLTVSTDVRQCGVLPPFAKFAHLVVIVERATSSLARKAKRATSARLQAQRDRQAQLVAKAAADAAAAAAQEKTFAALWRDGREEWEKHLGPDACFKLGLPPPVSSPSSAAAGTASANAAGTAASTTDSVSQREAKQDEEEQAAVLASSILGPRAACYTKLVASLFAGLERAAGANEKYKDVCRLENYAFFADAVNAATNWPIREQERKKRRSTLDGSCLELWHELDSAVADAREQYHINLTRYLDNAFKYEFPELEAFFARIEALVSSRGVGDVPIHLPREQLLTLLAAHGSAKVLKDKLKVCSKRFAKHLDPTLGLLPRVLAAWAAMLEARWSAYSARCTDCYNFTLEPSTLEVVAFVKEVAPSELS